MCLGPELVSGPGDRIEGTYLKLSNVAKKNAHSIGLSYSHYQYPGATPV